MTHEGIPLSKLPDGKTIAFTMEVRDWIDALLWEDEEHDPWVEQNLELRYVADAAGDGVPPEIRGWQLILECAQADYENTEIEDVGELCREIIFTLTDEDPGEWHEKRAKIVFDETFRPRFKSGGSYPEITYEEMMKLMQEFMVTRKRRKN